MKNQASKIIQILLDAVVVILFLMFFFGLALFGCSTKRDLTLPEEPTIWIVSFIHHDPKNPMPNGMVGYKIIPINPGTINARPTWKLDYPGKYYVGQRVDFAPLVPDGKGVE